MNSFSAMRAAIDFEIDRQVWALGCQGRYAEDSVCQAYHLGD